MRCFSCNGKDCLEDNDGWWYCNECGANHKQSISEVEKINEKTKPSEILKRMLKIQEEILESMKLMDDRIRRLELKK